MPTATSTRLTKSDRRTQLLDVAGELVLTQGSGSVTMERLAERAGVSKALVYLHFDNADTVLRELYNREIAHLGAQIVAAIDITTDRQTQLRAAVRTYFEVVKARGGLITVLAAAGSVAPLHPEQDRRVGHRFVAELFGSIFGLPPRRAQIAAAMFLGALNGGVEAWAAGELRRFEVEQAAVSVALHLAGEAAGR